MTTCSTIYHVKTYAIWTNA